MKDAIRFVRLFLAFGRSREALAKEPGSGLDKVKVAVKGARALALGFLIAYGPTLLDGLWQMAGLFLASPDAAAALSGGTGWSDDTVRGVLAILAMLAKMADNVHKHAGE